VGGNTVAEGGDREVINPDQLHPTLDQVLSPIRAEGDKIGLEGQTGLVPVVRVARLQQQALGSFRDPGFL